MDARRLNKRLRIYVGARGVLGFVGQFYFFVDSAYEAQDNISKHSATIKNLNVKVYITSDGSILCRTISDFSYEKAVVTYSIVNEIWVFYGDTSYKNIITFLHIYVG